MTRRNGHRVRNIAATACAAFFAFFSPAVAAVLPNDPGFSEQWYLRAIKAPDAWEYTVGAPAVTVALLDTGTDLDHPDLVRNIWYNVREVMNGMDDDGNGFPDDLRGWNFVDDVGDPQPRFTAFVPAGVNHGTVIAGEIAGRGGNGQGIAGVAWRVRIMPVRVLSSEGRGGEEAVIRGIDYAVRNGADIISMSFVTTPSPELRAAVKRAYQAGVLVVAAAGLQQNGAGRPNVGPDLDRFPGDPICSDGPNGENYVLGVGAVNAEDRLSSSSGYGKCIDLLAPGEQIYSTQVIEPQHGFVAAYGGGWIGPSLAVPLVAGAAALVKSAVPHLSAAGLRDVLMNTADNVDDKNPGFAGKLGRGRLNLARAFAALGVPRQSPAALVATRGRGETPEVRVLDARGSVLRSFYAYDPAFTGGVQIAAGDLDGDGHDEIVTAPGAGGGPHIRVFDAQGSLRTQFFASEQTDRRGYSVAVGDLDGDGRGEIVTAPLTGEMKLRIFEWTGLLRTSFIAYPGKFSDAVSIAVGDLDGDGRAEIVTAPGRGSGPHVKAWSRNGLLQHEFFAGLSSFRKGLGVVVADRDADGRAEIVIARLGEAQLTAFDPTGKVRTTIPLASPLPTAALAAGDLNRDGTDEVAIGAKTLFVLGRGGEELRTQPFGASTAPLRTAIVNYP